VSQKTTSVGKAAGNHSGCAGIEEEQNFGGGATTLMSGKNLLYQDETIEL